MSFLPDHFTATTVYVARHGERIDHVDPSWQKTAPNPHDPFLTETGIEQAAALGKRLKNANIAHIFSSPFYRTVQTANEVAKVINLPIKIEPGLIEWMNGNWFPEQPKLVPASVLKETFSLVDPTYKPIMEAQHPETRDQVVDRSCLIAKKLAMNYSGNILFIAHGIICEYTVTGLTTERRIPYISYCSLQTCKLSGNRAGYYIEGSKDPEINFMSEGIRPHVKTGYR